MNTHKLMSVYMDDQISRDLMLACRIIVTVWDTFTCPDGKVGE